MYQKDDYHFKPYHPVENSFREDYLNELKANNLDTGLFVVQEKIHGANLVFITDGSQIRCAKRTGLLDDNEKFYNFQKVKDRYRDKILAAYKLVKDLHPEMNELYIFGELFGGYYPDKSVPKVPDATRLQQGVFYSPDNDFCAFDLRVYNGSYLDVDLSCKIFQQLGFIYAEILFQGTLEECINYPNDFNSTIPGKLGLPLVPNNIVEGTVIKPMQVKFLPSRERVILKNKNAKYAETIIKKEKFKRPAIKISDAVKSLRLESENYVTENRLVAVMSKIGQLDLAELYRSKQIGRVLGPFAQDTVESFLKDFEDEFYQLEKLDQKLITQHISDACMALVKEMIASSKLG